MRSGREKRKLEKKRKRIRIERSELRTLGVQLSQADSHTSPMSYCHMTTDSKKREELQLKRRSVTTLKWRNDRKKLSTLLDKKKNWKYRDGEDPLAYLSSNVSNFLEIKSMLVVDSGQIDTLTLERLKEAGCNLTSTRKEDIIKRERVEKEVKALLIKTKLISLVSMREAPTLRTYFSGFKRFKDFVNDTRGVFDPEKHITISLVNSFIEHKSKYNIKKGRTTTYTDNSIKGEVSCFNALFQFRYGKIMSEFPDHFILQVTLDRIKKMAKDDTKMALSKSTAQDVRYSHHDLRKMVASVHKSMSINETEITEHSVWKERNLLNLDVLQAYSHSRDEIEKRYQDKRDPYFRLIVDNLVERKIDNSGPCYTFAALMLGFTCFHRDVTNRHIEFGHMRVESTAFPDLSDQLEVSMLGIDRVEEKVKSKKNGFNTSYVMRHKVPEQCTVFALAMHTFLNIRTADQLKRLNKEVLQRDQVRVLEKKIADGDREHNGEFREELFEADSDDQYDEANINRPIPHSIATIPTLKDKKAEKEKLRQQELEKNDWVMSRFLPGSYTTSYTKIKKFFVENEQIMASATHAGRKSGSYYSIQKGCARDEVSHHGGWKYMDMNTDVLFAYQPRSSPDVLKTLAGFELSETYHVPRSHFEVPESLKDRVFTWANVLLAPTDHHRMKKLLDFFATVLLQDLPFIFKKYPTHSLSFVEPFNSEEFRSYAQRVLKWHKKEKKARANRITSEHKEMSQKLAALESASYSQERKIDQMIELLGGDALRQKSKTDMLQLVELMHTLMEEKMVDYRLAQRSILSESVDSLGDELSKSTEEATMMLRLAVMRIQALHDNLSQNILPATEATVSDMKSIAKKVTSSRVLKLMQKTEKTKDEISDDEMDGNDLGTPAGDTASTDDDPPNTMARVLRKRTAAKLTTRKKASRSKSSPDRSKETSVHTSNKEIVTIRFNTSYREFLSEWLVGSPYLMGHPLIELKSAKYRNLPTSKILDPQLEETYKKYARVAKLFCSAFAEELMTDNIEAVTLIGKTITQCISQAQEEDHLKKILASPSSTASFLKSFHDEGSTLDTVHKRTEFLKKKIVEAKIFV